MLGNARMVTLIIDHHPSLEVHILLAFASLRRAFTRCCTDGPHTYVFTACAHQTVRVAPLDSITRKLFVYIARAHEKLGNSQAAIDACAEGLSFDPEDAELWYRKAGLHQHRREFAEAESCWRRILHLRRPDDFCSVNQGIYGHLTRRHLALLAAARGDPAEANRLWQAVLAECPGDVEAQEHLASLSPGMTVTLEGPVHTPLESYSAALPALHFAPSGTASSPL